MKTFFTVIGIILLLVIGFVVYVFVTLDPEELGQKVLRMVNEKTGVSLTAETFAVEPLKGLRLENGHLEGELDAGSVSGDLDRMAFDYELLPILKGEVVVHQILFEGPDLKVVSRPVEERQPEIRMESETAELEEELPADVPAEEPAPQEAREAGFLSAVSISEIRVVDGNLQVTSEGSDSGGLAVRGFDFELGDLRLDTAADPPLLGLAAKGGIRIDQVLFDDLEIQGGRGDLSVDHGQLAVTNIGVETPHAALEVAELATDLTQDPPPYRLRAGGSYDVNSLVEAEGEGFGPAAVEFSAQGAGPDIDRLVADGTFRLDDGQIPAFPVMVKIEKLLGKSLIVGYPYTGTEVNFHIANGKAEIEPFVLGFDSLQIAAAGAIDLAGPIDMQLDIRLPREAVSISVLDPFIDGMTDAEGWTTIPFDISGDLEEPDVDIDMTAVKETAKDLGKKAASKAVDSAVDSMKDKARSRRERKRSKNDG